jgi:transcriptional regulator with XRE-family HTH domain|tara:strand:+ start:260 stop:445 length:186 start_codon:yes stop_codon:yes gene_type:complete
MILEQIMKKKKLSKSQIAKDLNISEAYISMIFQGKRNLSVNMIKKIRDTYNVPWSKIMEEV